MSLSTNALLVEQCKFVTGLAPFTPSTSTPDYVSMKNAPRCTIVIMVDNATTVTGSAITVKQATDVAGTGEKALSFTKAYRNIDTAAAGGDLLTEFAVSSDTFTTTAVDNKNSLYIIEVEASDLDINNGFDCIRAGTGNATAAVLSVLYILWPYKHGIAPGSMAAAITD